MKRSNEPVFWALFGAGGMLSALIGPVLILITGIAVPLGFLLPEDTMRHERMLGLMQHPVGALGVFAVIALFLFHGCHRLLHSLHDLGVHSGRWGGPLFYGFAAVASIVAAWLLIGISA